MSDRVVYLMRGLPSCGKSHTARKLAESGGIVLVKNNLEDVVRALGLSQKTFSRIKINLFWAFIYNIIGIPIAAGVLTGAGFTLSPTLAGAAMAFSSLSVLLSSLLLNNASLYKEETMNALSP